MRLIDADKLHPDRMTNKGTVAISQSQIANAKTVEAVPLSVIEKIESKLQSEISRMEEIEKTCDYKRPHTLDWVLKLIKDEVKECTHEQTDSN